MSRFGTRADDEERRAKRPLSAFFFDCLHVEGEELIERTAGRGSEALDVPSGGGSGFRGSRRTTPEVARVHGRRAGRGTKA